MSDAAAFLAVIFPDNKAQLAELALATQKGLEKATGVKPTLVHPNIGALCLLTEGEFSRIASTLETACGNEVRWLLVRAEEPFSAFGLNAAATWLQHRVQR